MSVPSCTVCSQTSSHVLVRSPDGTIAPPSFPAPLSRQVAHRCTCFDDMPQHPPSLHRQQACMLSPLADGSPVSPVSPVPPAPPLPVLRATLTDVGELSVSTNTDTYTDTQMCDVCTGRVPNDVPAHPQDVPHPFLRRQMAEVCTCDETETKETD